MTKTIDIHAHVIGEDTIALMQKEAPKIGPRITPIDDEFAGQAAAMLGGKRSHAAAQ